MIDRRGSGLFRRRVSASPTRRRPDFATVVVLACCPFLGAAAVLVLDPATSTPPAVTADAPVTDAPVPPLLALDPSVDPTSASTPERPTTTARVAPPATTSRAPEPAPATTPTSAPQPSATPTPEPEPGPEPERPIWTQADQDAADARCEAALPGSRAENTPDIGDTYDPDVRYPCAGEPGRSSLLPHL